MENKSIDLRVIRRSVAYISANLAHRALGIVLLAVLVAYLPPSAFTRYGLLSSVVPLLVYIFTLNIHLAPQRTYFDEPLGRDRSSLLRSSFVASLGLALPISLIAFAAARALHLVDPLTTGSISIQLAVVASVWLTALFQYSITVARIRAAGGIYTLLLNMQRGGFILTFLVLAWSGVIDFSTVAVAYVAGLAISGGVGILVYRRDLLDGSWRFDLASKSFHFSWPTVIHGFSIWSVASSGRWIGSFFIALEDLAAYTLMTSFFGIVSTMVRAVFEARIPDIGSAFADERYTVGSRVINSATWASIGLTVATYAALGVALYGFGLELPADYMPSASLIAVAGAANVLDVIYLRANNLLTAMKRTGLQAGASLAAGFVSIVVSLVLVSRFAIAGLLASYVLAWTVQSTVTTLVAQQAVSRQDRPQTLENV